MFRILQIAASCRLVTLHWSYYQLGQSCTVCTFRHKFILLGPRPRDPEEDISTSCRCTHFLYQNHVLLKSIIVFINSMHSVVKPRYSFETFCAVGKNQSILSWLIIFLRFTLVIALKINVLLFHRKHLSTSSNGISEIFGVCHDFFKIVKVILTKKNQIFRFCVNK